MTIETATGEKSMQDISSELEGKLFPSEDEPESVTDDEVVEDVVVDEQLPDDDDSDSDDDEGSDEVDDTEIADDDELSLASYLGLDEDRIEVDDDGNVFMKAIIDGETKNVDLKELAKSYQLQGHVNNKSVALEEERKALEQLQIESSNLVQEKIQGLTALSQVLENQVVQEFESIDWERLRVENPSEWTALRQEFADRANQVQRAQELIQEQAQISMQEQQKTLAAQQSEILRNELDRMIQNNPDWADESKLKVAQTEIRDFMTDTYSFSEQDLSMISDHRVIQVIQDAMAFRQGKKAVEEKKSKVVPQFKKPGISRKNAKAMAKARDVKAKKAAVRKNGGHVNDIAAVIESRM